MTGWLPLREIERREQLSTNWSYMLNVGIENLHKCLWVGIVEELDKSLEMLSYQTGLDIHMKHLNKNKRRKDLPKKEQITMLENLLPVDMYLYEYAKQLHNHRYQIYLAQKSETNRIPYSYPNLTSVIKGCKSTRFKLVCQNLNLSYSYSPSDAWLKRTLNAVPLSRTAKK